MSIEINDKIIETDEEGYLVNLDDWNDELFPHGPVRMLCKLAGLPKPVNEVET